MEEKQEIVTRSYICPRIGGEATLSFHYDVLGDNSRELYKFDCNKKMHCDITEDIHSGAWTIDWDKCPAVKRYYIKIKQ